MSAIFSTTNRVRCLCPGCRRTTAKPFAEWICGVHWRSVPKAMRGRMFRFRRRAKRDPRWIGVADRMWERCKQRAIDEALMGVML